MRAIKTLRASFFQSHVSKLDQKKYSKFFYCYTGVDAGCSTKEATDSSFRRVLKKIIEIQDTSTSQR